MINIQDVLERQQIELSDRLKRPYINRRIKTPLLNTALITVVLGPRRSGKSFFCSHTLHNLQESYGYVNFDDEQLIQIDDYDKIIAAMNATYKSPKYLLLDEIQNLPRWELFLNRLQRQGMRLMVTGSNAHLLSSELATHLTGRHLPVALFPFSFAEYLDALYPDRRPAAQECSADLRSYLRDGGLPETVVTEVDKHDYIATLFNAVIYKDIVKRHRLSNAASIENLARYCMSNTGFEYSFRTLTSAADCKSDRTVRRYLRFLEEAFLIFSIDRFSHKFKEQASSNKKVYAIDNAWINAIGFSMSPNIGRLAENAVAIALKKLQLQNHHTFFFWKSSRHEEVDFVIVKDRKIDKLIQVCFNVSEPKTREREIRALLKAGNELKCSNLIILNEDKEEIQEAEWFGLSGKIHFLPLWKWLLDENAV